MGLKYLSSAIMGRLLLLDGEALTKTLMTFAREIINNKSTLQSIGILMANYIIEASKWLFS